MGGKSSPVIARLKRNEHEFARLKLKNVKEDNSRTEISAKGCILIKRAPTKEGGYMQLPTSTNGTTNKVLLHHIALFDDFDELQRKLAEDPKLFEGKDVSHLCHDRRCANKDHLCLEDSIKNQRRKGCRGTVKVTCPCPCGVTFFENVCACCNTNKCI